MPLSFLLTPFHPSIPIGRLSGNGSIINRPQREMTEGQTSSQSQRNLDHPQTTNGTGGFTLFRIQACPAESRHCTQCVPCGVAWARSTYCAWQVLLHGPIDLLLETLHCRRRIGLFGPEHVFVPFPCLRTLETRLNLRPTRLSMSIALLRDHVTYGLRLQPGMMHSKLYRHLICGEICDMVRLERPRRDFHWHEPMFIHVPANPGSLLRRLPTCTLSCSQATIIFTVSTNCGVAPESTLTRLAYILLRCAIYTSQSTPMREEADGRHW
jgi:hypothetical protein